MNGAQRRIALALAAGFLAMMLVIMVANATSMISDFQANGVPVSAPHVWLFEASSIVAWLTEVPAIWWLILLLRRRWPAWPLILGALLLATLPLSGWHIGLMVGLRKLGYALTDEHYRFTLGVANPFIYEYRKDVATILQFAGLALIAQWLIARAATPASAKSECRTLPVSDGAITHHVPLDEIERVAAAGNYVEVLWNGRTLLQRATLAATEAELGSAFVRIHRGLLVRRAAIRRIETDKSGDFTVELESGTEVRGSRRYRAGLAGGGGV